LTNVILLAGLPSSQKLYHRTFIFPSLSLSVPGCGMSNPFVHQTKIPTCRA